MGDRFQGRISLPKALVRRFAYNIIHQYYFANNIKDSLFPINHINRISDLQGVYIDDSLTQSLFLVMGNHVAWDEERLFDVLFQHSAWFNVNLLLHRIHNEVLDLFGEYVRKYKLLMYRLETALQGEQSINVVGSNTSITLDTVLGDTVKLSRQADNYLKKTLQSVIAIIDEDLAAATTDVMRIGFLANTPNI